MKRGRVVEVKVPLPNSCHHRRRSSVSSLSVGDCSQQSSFCSTPPPPGAHSVAILARTSPEIRALCEKAACHAMPNDDTHTTQSSSSPHPSSPSPPPSISPSCILPEVTFALGSISLQQQNQPRLGRPPTRPRKHRRTTLHRRVSHDALPTPDQIANLVPANVQHPQPRRLPMSAVP